MKRDASIELFRIGCIFGVCFLHALEQGGYAAGHRGLDYLMMSSVVGFVFISGWFGIRLRASHVLRLLGIGVYCALVPVVLFDWLHCGHADVIYLLSRFWKYYQEPWFLWAYFALMFLAPTFEPLFTQSDKKAILVKVLPVAFVAFFWSYAATTIPVLKIYMPHVTGFGGFGIMTFIGIYLIARTCRVCGLDRLLKARNLLFMAALSGVFCWIGFGHYCSPFAVVFAASAFFLVKKLVLPSSMERIILWLSPSVFSIYLIHRQAMGMAWMHYVEDALICVRGCNYYLVCLLVAVTFFMGALLLDLPRRLVASVAASLSGKVYDSMSAK